jgi:hypothetical protein
MYNPLLGPEGRAAQAAMKDLPPDQQMKYLNDSVAKGLIPFGQAVAVKMMMERVAQNPPAQPGQANSPTVMDEYKAKIAEVQNPRTGGIAQLPAANMGRVAAASGGVIGYAGGGLTPHEEAEREFINSMLTSSQGVATRSMYIPAGERGDLTLEDRERFVERLNYLNNLEETGNTKQSRTEKAGRLGQEAAQRGLRYMPMQTPKAGQTPPQAGQTPPQADQVSPQQVDILKYLGGVSSADPSMGGGVSGMRYSSQGSSGSGQGGISALLGPISARAQTEFDTAKKGLLTPEEYTEQLKKRYTGAGVLDPYTEYRKTLQEDIASAKKGSEKDRRLAIASGFFEAAANAQPGQGFLGSIASGAAGAIRGLSEVKKDAAKTNRELARAQFELNRLQAGVEQNLIDRGDTKYQTALARVDSLNDRLTTVSMKVGEITLDNMSKSADRATQLAAARIAAASRGDYGDPGRQLQMAWMRAISVGDKPAANEIYENMKKLAEADPRVISAGLDADTRKDIADARAKAAAQGNSPINLSTDQSDPFPGYGNVGVQ